MERLGHLFGAVQDVLALQGGTATARVLSTASLETRLLTLATDYNTVASGGSKAPNLLQGDNGFGGSSTSLATAVNSWDSTAQSFFSALQQIAQNTVIQMCDYDAGGLQQRTLSFALQYLINQMVTNSTTVNSTTVSVGSQSSVGSPTGNPVFVLTGLNGLGQTVQYAYTDAFTYTTTADAQTGGQTSGQEQISIVGSNAQTNQWSYLWPTGSGIASTLNLCSATVNNGGANANLTTNGSFSAWSNGTSGFPPDNWTALIGTGQIGQSSTAYFGSYSTQFTGDSSTLTSMAQSFNTPASTTLNAGGTQAKLSPLTLYCFNVWYKLTSASPAAGVFQIDLVNSSNTIIDNYNGGANSASVALTGIADTNWHTLSLVAALPTVLPSAQKIRAHLTTALTSGTNLLIGGIACDAMTTLYAGGPSLSPFSGNTATIEDDSWQQTFTPTWGTVQQFMQQFFNMNSLGLTIPNTASSPTVADSTVS